jgi:hypothetical protein
MIVGDKNYRPTAGKPKNLSLLPILSQRRRSCFLVWQNEKAVLRRLVYPKLAEGLSLRLTIFGR